MGTVVHWYRAVVQSGGTERCYRAMNRSVGRGRGAWLATQTRNYCQLFDCQWRTVWLTKWRCCRTSPPLRCSHTLVPSRSHSHRLVCPLSYGQFSWHSHVSTKAQCLSSSSGCPAVHLSVCLSALASVCQSHSHTLPFLLALSPSRSACLMCPAAAVLAVCACLTGHQVANRCRRRCCSSCCCCGSYPAQVCAEGVIIDATATNLNAVSYTTSRLLPRCSNHH